MRGSPGSTTVPLFEHLLSLTDQYGLVAWQFQEAANALQTSVDAVRDALKKLEPQIVSPVHKVDLEHHGTVRISRIVGDVPPRKRRKRSVKTLIVGDVKFSKTQQLKLCAEHLLRHLNKIAVGGVAHLTFADFPDAAKFIEPGEVLAYLYHCRCIKFMKNVSQSRQGYTIVLRRGPWAHN
jgi:hypothetical protein